MRGDAVLFSEMTPRDDFEAEFNHWYDEEHIPIRMQAPGFQGARRYRRQDSPGYLAVYELAAIEALKTPVYNEIKGKPSEQTRWMLKNVSGFTRYLCTALSVTEKETAIDPLTGNVILYAVWFNVPKDAEEEFDAWYEQDHIPLLMQCPQWLQVRRFAVEDGEPKHFTRLALHYLENKSALASPEREAARATEWRKRLAEREWFKGEYALFDPYGDVHKGLHPEL